MGTSLLKFSDVRANHANPATLRQTIEGTLMANDDACADAIQPYLTTPGVMGSTEWDHAMAVNIVLKHDKENGGRIASTMVASNMSPRMLWDQLVKVYRANGFQMKRGRLIGVLEDRSGENEDTEEGIE